VRGITYDHSPRLSWFVSWLLDPFLPILLFSSFYRLQGLWVTDSKLVVQRIHASCVSFEAMSDLKVVPEYDSEKSVPAHLDKDGIALGVGDADDYKAAAAQEAVTTGKEGKGLYMDLANGMVGWDSETDAANPLYVSHAPHPPHRL
jgi:hypothetical protein